MEKFKSAYRKLISNGMVAVHSAKQSVHNVMVGDAGLSDAVVTVIILLAGVVCAMLVYSGAKVVVGSTTNTVQTQTNTLIGDMTSNHA